MEGMGFPISPNLLWKKDPRTDPFPLTALRDPAIPPALTGDIEPDGSFHGTLTFWQVHLTGEVAAMVLHPWGEGQHRGAEGLAVQRVKSTPHPEEAERSSFFAGSPQTTGQVRGIARLHGLRKVDVGFLCQG